MILMLSNNISVSLLLIYMKKLKKEIILNGISMFKLLMQMIPNLLNLQDSIFSIPPKFGHLRKSHTKNWVISNSIKMLNPNFQKMNNLPFHQEEWSQVLNHLMKKCFKPEFSHILILKDIDLELIIKCYQLIDQNVHSWINIMTDQ